MLILWREFVSQKRTALSIIILIMPHGNVYLNVQILTFDLLTKFKESVLPIVNWDIIDIINQMELGYVVPSAL